MKSAWVLMAALALGLAACAEKKQELESSSRKPDAKAWSGADNGYAAGGWKATDQPAWEQQMRSRALAQDEYSRAGKR